MDNDSITVKQFLELASRAEKRGIYTFSDFLGLREINLLKQSDKIIGRQNYTLFGGNEHCERVIARFGNPDTGLYDLPFPISIIHVQPVSEKYAEDLSHRDILGSIMALGIERDKTGDIFIDRKDIYFFCTHGIAEYIVNNLEKIKHTTVKCSVVEELPIDPSDNLKEQCLRIPSNRIDCIISVLYHLSREESKALITSEKVFCNGATVKSISASVDEGDIISVRGFGRFIFDGICGQSKKGKLLVSVRVY